MTRPLHATGRPQRLRPLVLAALLLALVVALLPLAPPAVAAPELFYDDRLAPGWLDWSWASADLDATAPVHSGSRSIAVSYTPWAGLYLYNPGAYTGGFTTLRFFVHGGDAGGQQMQMYATYSDGADSAQGPVIALPLPVAGAWSEVHVPLAELGVENSFLTGLVWQDRSGTAQPPVYIDDVALVAGESPDGPALTPQGGPIPAAARADGETQVIVRVWADDPQGPADVAAVTVDAAPFGRGRIALRDDGLSNDGAGGDGLYGGRFTVAPGTPTGEYALVVTAEDRSGHRASLSLGAFVVLETPGGTVPPGLPTRIGWGTHEWSETPEEDWQLTSGVPWDYVYQYITYGWYESGWGGDFVGRFTRQAWSKNFIPVISVYLMLGLPPSCGESPACYAQKLQDPTAVGRYFQALQEAARQANGDWPVIFHLEPDFYGYMQQLSNSRERPAGVLPDDPSSYPVALNVPGYPDNLAGFGQRMVDLIHTSAPNALVAPHASMWAANREPNGVTRDEVVEIARQTAGFIDAMGGAQSDLLFVEWSDRDAGTGTRPWWDVTNRSFPRPTRAILWENALSAASGKRLFLWQIPVGNMALDNTCNRYQDNRVAYISTHLRDLADAGVAALLFGAGGPCMTRPTTDGGFLAAQAQTAFAAPATPTGVMAATSGPAVTVRWNENGEPDVWGYYLTYQPVGGGPTTMLDTGRANSAGLMLGPGGWQIRVAAYDALGQFSRPSEPILATIGSTTTYRVFLPTMIK
ncbi:MAG TPA: choice-of-anchor X domain-containing protein [Ardenticatenaceae bacterium]|nr:choice-of-anchor X domain-containing protein [Ardenticatenaceae bacterium]